MGGMLSQLIKGKWHPIAYRSQSLSPVERNYEIHDRELLAIMRALEDWRQYLLGATCPFEVWIDHRNLTYFKKVQELNRRQARWHTELQEYDFQLVHKPGTQMKRADILSDSQSMPLAKRTTRTSSYSTSNCSSAPSSWTPWMWTF